jgi:hypothetical protein
MALKLAKDNRTQAIAVALRAVRGSAKVNLKSRTVEGVPVVHALVKTTPGQQIAVATSDGAESLLLGFSATVQQLATKIGNQSVMVDVFPPQDEGTAKQMLKGTWLATTAGKRFAEDSLVCFIVKLQLEEKRDGTKGKAPNAKSLKKAADKKKAKN